MVRQSSACSSASSRTVRSRTAADSSDVPPTALGGSARSANTSTADRPTTADPSPPKTRSNGSLTAVITGPSSVDSTASIASDALSNSAEKRSRSAARAALSRSLRALYTPATKRTSPPMTTPSAAMMYGFRLLWKKYWNPTTHAYASATHPVPRIDHRATIWVYRSSQSFRRSQTLDQTNAPDSRKTTEFSSSADVSVSPTTKASRHTSNSGTQNSSPLRARRTQA